MVGTRREYVEVHEGNLRQGDFRGAHRRIFLPACCASPLNFRISRKIQYSTGGVRNKSFLKIFNFLSELCVREGSEQAMCSNTGTLKRRYRWTWGTFHSSLAVLQQQQQPYGFSQIDRGRNHGNGKNNYLHAVLSLLESQDNALGMLLRGNILIQSSKHQKNY